MGRDLKKSHIVILFGNVYCTIFPLWSSNGNFGLKKKMILVE